MPPPQSLPIRLPRSSLALRLRTSTAAREPDAHRGRNSASLQRWRRTRRIKGERCPPPPRSNFGETKLRGPLESTKLPKKWAKTKLSEAENPSEVQRAPKEPPKSPESWLKPVMSAVWITSGQRSPGHSKPQGTRRRGGPGGAGRREGTSPGDGVGNRSGEASPLGSIGERKAEGLGRRAIFAWRRRINALDGRGLPSPVGRITIDRDSGHCDAGCAA
jgi:hypothetical protein